MSFFYTSHLLLFYFPRFFHVAFFVYTWDTNLHEHAGGQSLLDVGVVVPGGELGGDEAKVEAFH